MEERTGTVQEGTVLAACYARLRGQFSSNFQGTREAGTSVKVCSGLNIAGQSHSAKGPVQAGVRLDQGVVSWLVLACVRESPLVHFLALSQTWLSNQAQET